MPTTISAKDLTYKAFVDGVFRSGSRRELGEADLFVPLMQSSRELLFADLRGKIGDDSTYEGNWGIGYRKWLSSDWIVGAYGFYDLRHTVNNNNFQQATFGVELLDVNWDFRVNGYVPERGAKNTPSSGGGGTTGFVFQGNGLFRSTAGGPGSERAYYGVDAEIGRLLYTFGGRFDAELRGYIGGYHFDNDTGGFENITGPRVRTELRLFDLPRLGLDSRVVLGGEFQWDDVRGTQGVGVIQVRVPFGAPRKGRRLSPMQRRMVTPVVRDIDIVTNSVAGTQQQLVQLTDGGNAITMTHVQLGAAGTNTGTFENPFNMAVLPATQGTNIVYIHAGGTFTGGYTAGMNQRVLGEGGGNNHSVNTDQLGAINLPAGNGGATRPIVQDTMAAANGSEISNFDIQSATQGIQGNALTGNVNVNRTQITGGTTGIDITGGSGTFTFSDVDVTNTSTAGLNVSGGTSNVTLDTNSTISQSGAGVGSAVVVNNQTGGTVDLNGLVTANTGTVTGVNLTNNTGATINFDGGLNIDTTTGIGFNATGGGTITTDDPAGAVEADVTSTAGTAINLDGIVIGTTGMQFSDIVSTGGTNGIAINNVTGQTFSIASGNTVNIQNSTGDGLSITNSSATFSFNSGAATTTTVSNAGSEGIFLSGNTGNITFDTIAVDGSTNEGIEIVNNTGTVTVTDGTIGATTTNAGGVLVNGAGGGTGNITIGADITNSSGIAVAVTNRTGGNTTFSGTINQSTAATGVNVTNNTGGTIDFDAEVTANTSTATGINLVNNTGATINFDGGFDIDTTSGTGFNATGGGTITTDDPAGSVEADVTSTAGTAINLDGIVIGTTGMQFADIVSTGGANGISINNVTGQTFSIASGNTVNIQNSTGDGLSITNSSATFNFNSGAATTTTVSNAGSEGIFLSGNTGNITFDTIAVDGSTNEGIEIVNNTGTVTVTDGTIGATTTNAGGVLVNGAGGGTGNITIGADITNSSGIAVAVTNRTGGNTTFSGTINQSTAATGVNVTNNTGGTIDFDAEVTANTSTATGINLVNNTGATINFDGGFDIDTTSGTGFNATGGGTITTDDPAGSVEADVTSTAGTAINLDGIVIGTTGMQFSDIVSTGGANGIAINNVTGQTFSIASGNTVNIQNSTGDGLSITNTSANTSFTTIDIDNPGTRGLHLDNNSGNFVASGHTDVDGASNNFVSINIANGSGDVTFQSTVDVTPAMGGTPGGNPISISSTGGTIGFNGLTTISTPAGRNAISVASTTGGSATFANIDINHNGGTASVLSINNNTGTVAFNDGEIDNMGFSLAGAIDSSDTSLTVNSINIGQNQAVNGDGININQNTMTTRTVTLSNNTISVDGKVIDIAAAMGDLRVHVTNNGLTSTGGLDSLEADTTSAAATLCLNASGNSGVGGGAPTNFFDLNHTAGSTFNVQQANAANLSTVNNNVTVTADPGVNFNVMCPP